MAQINIDLARIESFAQRTQFFVLTHLFGSLLSRYVELYENMVSYANSKLMLYIKPDCDVDDLINPIIEILENQRGPLNRIAGGMTL